MEKETTHKRRIHYSGKYPRKFEEKYKELNPLKYQDIAEHVMKKGNTPAGTHISIMVEEILQILDIKPGQHGLDCTFGYGGHSLEMLKKLAGEGMLVALDVDPVESLKSKERLQQRGFGEDILHVENINFSDVDIVSQKYGKFDFILADLGVSSMQIDNPQRGFSYKTEGPLDLRMDQTKGVSGSELLCSLCEEEIMEILIENADEPYAKQIAKGIIDNRRKGIPVSTTSDFKKIIEEALVKARVPAKELRDVTKKTCARCFQALRIEVNQEFCVLEKLLYKLPDILNPGGRVVFLTFHSGEDRLVKQMFKQQLRDGLYTEISRDVIRPSKQECIDNPRATSTKLRWAVK